MAPLLAAALYAGDIGEPVEPVNAMHEKEIEVLPMDEVSDGRFENSSSKNKVYTGAAIGSMRASGSNTASGVSLSLLLGYTLNQYVSLEARYATLIADADYGAGTRSVTMNNFGAYLKSTLPISKSLSPYGLLGYGKTSFDGSSSSGFQWGLGLNYSLTEKVDFFADYISYYSGDFNGDFAENIDVTSYNVGSTYSF